MRENAKLVINFVGQTLGQYKILELIGMGGSGVVYLAKKSGQDRKVAIKLIKPGMASTLIRKRFQQEQQILGSLNHPFIARLYDTGETEDGHPYHVLEYVKGIPLTTYCIQKKLPLVEILSLFQKVCDAVAEAHRNLIVHRDLKPGNILIDDEGNPRLLDFGIADLLDREPDHETQDQSLTLTPKYAAPEQRVSHSITTAADIYSLGLILQESLPSQKVPKDLKSIISMATRIEPDKRYGSVSQLSEDLTLFQQNRPVLARGKDRIYHLQQFFLRNRAASLIFLLILLLPITINISLNRQQQVTAIERDRAEQATSKAQAETHKTTQAVQWIIESVSQSANQSSPVTTKNFLDHAAANLDSAFRDDPETRITLLGQISAVYIRMGIYDLAKPLIEEASLLTNANLSDHDPLRIQILIDQANFHQSTEQYDKAYKEYNQALNLLKKQENASPQKTLGIMFDITYINLKARKWRKAFHHFNEFVKFQNQIGFSDPLDQIIFYGRQALFAYQTRDHEKASYFFCRQLELFEQNNIIYHPERIKTLNMLASTNFILKNYEEAKRLYLLSIEACLKLYEPKSNVFYTPYRGLVKILAKDKQFEHASAYAELMLEIMEASFEWDSPRTLYTIALLGEQYLGAGKIKEAIDMFHIAANYPYPADHAYNVFHVMFDIINKLGKEGLFENAFVISEKALAFQDKHQNRNYYGQLLHMHAKVLHALGKLEQARDAYHNSDAILSKDTVYYRNNIVARVPMLLGAVSRDLEDLNEAMCYTDKATHLALKHYGPNHYTYGDTLAEQALVYQEIGQFDMAYFLCHKAIQAQINSLGPDHPRVAQNLIYLAFLPATPNTEAQQSAWRASQIYRKHYPPNHWLPAWADALLAHLLIKAGQKETAMLILEPALDILLAKPGVPQSSLAIALKDAIAIYPPQSKKIIIWKSKQRSLSKELPSFASPISRRL